MAEMKDAHIVEIPVDEEHQQKLICSMNSITAIQNHPLAEISNSPGPSLCFSSFGKEKRIFLAVKVCRYWKVWRQLQREKNDNRALTRCIQELRMKGASFDLSKEPLSGKRMKSSSVWCFLLPNSCFADSDQGRLLACGFLPTEGCDDLNSKVFSAPFLQEFLMLDFGRFDDVIASLISSRG
ncbi:hypothetical protein OIU85_002914 [Salix viminalis]|uniref:Uncharacterized protein n=1 Tax=Salix viminalis TaxID=40686 RepID=A0A9Q0VPS4_SALVM|nr:hypothetical protein OIU85_002914 [Salix viminalis]